MKKNFLLPMLTSFILFAPFVSLQAEVKNITVVNHEVEGTKQWVPGNIIVEEGDDVNLTLINNVPSGIHGFQIPAFKIKEDVKKKEVVKVSFKADKAGIYPINCHLHPAHVGGQLVILKKINP